MNAKDILDKLGNKNENTDHMVWIGRNYSIADLKKDLKEMMVDKKFDVDNLFKLME